MESREEPGNKLALKWRPTSLCCIEGKKSVDFLCVERPSGHLFHCNMSPGTFMKTSGFFLFDVVTRAENNSRSSDTVRSNFEYIQPISHYDRT